MASRRFTKQRQLILDIVSSSCAHPAAEQVYEVAKQSMPAISLGTVYRNLRLLVDEGKLREVQFAGDVTRYDGMLETHEHFYCRRCKSVMDLTSRPQLHHERKLEQLLHVRIESRSLDYYGLCSSCARSEVASL